jgi:hypothetical protein
MSLFIHPPLNQLVLYPAPHDQQAMEAFTPGSRNQDEFLRGLLECFLHSTWMHNQHYEPQMMDDYSKYVLRQLANLNGSLPADFNNPRKSLLAFFVGRSDTRPSCLICSKPQDTIPRALSCVRAHLRLKPFRCEGCPSCNRKNRFVYPAFLKFLIILISFHFIFIPRYATFGSAALLRDHMSGQKTATCTEW